MAAFGLGPEKDEAFYFSAPSSSSSQAHAGAAPPDNQDALQPIAPGVRRISDEEYRRQSGEGTRAAVQQLRQSEEYKRFFNTCSR